VWLGSNLRVSCLNLTLLVGLEAILGALKAGFELRQKFLQSQVKVHDVNEQTPVYEHSENKTEAALN